VPVPLSRASQRGRRHVPIDAHIWRAVGARPGTAKQRAVFRSQLARSRRYGRSQHPVSRSQHAGAEAPRAVGSILHGWPAIALGPGCALGRIMRAQPVAARRASGSIRDATLAIRAHRQARRDHRTDTGHGPRWTRLRVGGGVEGGGGGAEGGGGVDGFSAGAAGSAVGARATRRRASGVMSRSRGRVPRAGRGMRAWLRAGVRTARGTAARNRVAVAW